MLKRETTTHSLVQPKEAFGSLILTEQVLKKKEEFLMEILKDQWLPSHITPKINVFTPVLYQVLFINGKEIVA
jgi:hypothetical protein